MDIDEELAKKLMAKELKSKQEVLLKKKSLDISPEERNLTKENWDITAPLNGMKFNLWPSAIYPGGPDVDIEEQRASTNDAYEDALQCLRQYVLDMVIDFGVDWEIGQLGEKEAKEPNLDLNMENELPGNKLKKLHRGVVFSSKD
ncbi:unnamed protein product [Lactuca saligna]|uniref:Uncharacterized protein n=1 Tax=Lactuca saligna TaxID=75948 RepID=A0AA36EJE4_LACSI|nr:unnamed protein product [Lactuca saligna]